MKMVFIIFIIIVFFVSVWSFISLHLPDDPDKPSLFIDKTRRNGEKLVYVYFRANKKSPLRCVFRGYKGKAPTKKEMYQSVLYSPWFKAIFDGSEEEWELMCDTIKKELSNK